MKTEFDEFIQNDLEKQKGIFIPVKAGILERFLVKKTAISNLHPNAEDEFTFPTVGPSYKIISEYMDQIRKNQRLDQPIFDEPLIVEKVRPQGYLLLNGHHRWAAALKLTIKSVPIKIVNVAQESDIRKMIERSNHDKRVTLDLEEIVFRNTDDPLTEPIPGLSKKIQRIRLGIPGLFHYLTKHGYDIWVYSENYYSIDDIKRLFWRYSVNVDGIITGKKKFEKRQSEAAINMRKLIANKYKETIHIDNKMVIHTHRDDPEFIDYKINGPEEKWSANVIDIIETIKG